MAAGPDHSQCVELRRGQSMIVDGVKVRKTFWAGRIEVTSPPDEFLHKPPTHKVIKGASYGMSYFELVDGQQVAHAITFT